MGESYLSLKWGSFLAAGVRAAERGSTNRDFRLFLRSFSTANSAKKTLPMPVEILRSSSSVFSSLGSGGLSSSSSLDSTGVDSLERDRKEKETKSIRRQQNWEWNFSCICGLHMYALFSPAIRCTASVSKVN